MRSIRTPGASGAGGQIIVIMALALVALLAMVALIVDGGNAFAQQRQTQNAADAAAEAGAVVLVQRMAGVVPAKTDADVVSAVNSAAAANGIATPTAVYTDINGTSLGVTVGGATGNLIPTAAAGVEAAGSKSFRTQVAGVIGLNTLTASARATAVAGVLQQTCSADAGCGVLPVTFPLQQDQCDDSGDQDSLKIDWTKSNYDLAIGPPPTGIEYTIPLCKNGPGTVGWLDWAPPNGGTSELVSSITTPDNPAVSVPGWVGSESGNTNAKSVEDAINAYHYKVVLIPQFDGPCATTPTGPNLSDCTSTNGNASYWHVPQFANFMVDVAYTNGANNPQCSAGTPVPPFNSNGGTGCIKGWFLDFLGAGHVIGPSTGPGSSTAALGVQLIK